MAALKRSKSIILFWRAHRWLYKISDGRLGSTLMGHKILKLTTTGHRSGKPRVILIYYFPYQDSYVIVASNLGAEWYPAWYLNLRAHPSAEIQIGRERKKVRARTAVGAEREQLWSMIVKADASFAELEHQMEREIPVVILDPHVTSQ